MMSINDDASECERLKTRMIFPDEPYDRYQLLVVSSIRIASRKVQKHFIYCFTRL